MLTLRLLVRTYNRLQALSMRSAGPLPEVKTMFLKFVDPLVVPRGLTSRAPHFPKTWFDSFLRPTGGGRTTKNTLHPVVAYLTSVLFAGGGLGWCWLGGGGAQVMCTPPQMTVGEPYATPAVHKHYGSIN